MVLWQNDIMPVLSGDQGNQWLAATADLTPYVGNIVNLRFRGNTGIDFTSDMAIDDISINETSAPPVPAFHCRRNFYLCR